jgi:hypothetical protein
MDPVQPPAGDSAVSAAAGEPPKESDAPAPKYITEEQLQGTLSERFRAFEHKVDKTLSAIGPKLKDELAALLPKPEPPKAEPPKPEGQAAGDKEPESHAELRRLQEQISQLTKQNEDARTERDAERARARDVQLRQKLGESLATAGIEGVRARHAIGLLVDAERRLRWSEDGQAILFRGDGGDELDLAAGIRDWLKTEDAKLYLPPRGAAGSGDKPGLAPPPRAPSGPPDRSTVAEGLRRVLLGQL